MYRHLASLGENKKGIHEGCVSVFRTFTGGQRAFQLVVSVCFRWQWRLCFSVIEAVQAALGLTGRGGTALRLS